MSLLRNHHFFPFTHHSSSPRTPPQLFPISSATSINGKFPRLREYPIYRALLYWILCALNHAALPVSLARFLGGASIKFPLVSATSLIVKSSLFGLSESQTDGGRVNMGELQEDIFFQWICVIILVSYAYMYKIVIVELYIQSNQFVLGLL